MTPNDAFLQARDLPSWQPRRFAMMEQLCVNRSERMRWRAFNIEARAGRYRNADKLVALSFEAHTIRERDDG